METNTRETALLYDISNALVSGEEIHKILNMVLTVMSEHMGMHKGMITVLDQQRGEIYIEESFGLTEIEAAKGKYKLGEGIVGKVVETGEPIIVPKVSREPAFLNKTESRRNLKDKDISFICVPIKSRHRTIGALSADRFFGEDISLEEDVKLLSIIATMIYQAVRLYQSINEENASLQEQNSRLLEQLKDRFKETNIIGKSKMMREVFKMIHKISTTQANVLILGESGVGKELVAHAIHYNSSRAEAPFVACNISSLSESIIESELFGHVKGAFTGAFQTRKGKFEEANGGTIFLDEIGELSLPVQTKLLRVLQQRELERVGSSETISLDIRIVTATNKDLEKLVKEGKFREDLFYRLNVFPITVCPLRERKTDIPLLADYFIEKYNKVNNKKIRRISTPAIDMLMSYHWPGNVRELENCIERAVILSDDDVIHSFHLPPSLQTAMSSSTRSSGSLKNQIEALEYEMIVEALKETNGNMSRAAALLGFTMRMLGLRVQKYGIIYKKFRSNGVSHEQNRD